LSGFALARNRGVGGQKIGPLRHITPGFAPDQHSMHATQEVVSSRNQCDLASLFLASKNPFEIGADFKENPPSESAG